LLEDRVVTTDQLIRINGGAEGWLQLGPGVLSRLEPLGLHVLVPSGHLHTSEEDVLSCMAELQVGKQDPLPVRVLLPLEMYEALPRAFDVLARIPATATGMVSELEEWIANDTTWGEADGSD
jgi:hypothetical protein